MFALYSVSAMSQAVEPCGEGSKGRGVVCVGEGRGGTLHVGCCGANLASWLSETGTFWTFSELLPAQTRHSHCQTYQCHSKWNWDHELCPAQVMCV